MKSDSPRALDEAKQIYALTNENLLKSLEILERQLNVLHTRAQVLMTLAGVVLTVTGFSGRVIAGTSSLAKMTIVLGLLIVLTSAVWVWSRVMGIKWVTDGAEGEPIEVLRIIIERRNLKTRAYRLGGVILSLGLFVYGLAVAQMFLFSV